MLFTTEDLMKRMNIEIGDVFEFKGHRKQVKAVVVRKNEKEAFLLDQEGIDFGTYSLDHLVNHSYKVIKGNCLKSYNKLQFAKDLGIKPGDSVKTNNGKIFTLDARYNINTSYYITVLLNENFEKVKVVKKGELSCYQIKRCENCALFGICNKSKFHETTVTLNKILEEKKNYINPKIYSVIKEELEKEVTIDENSL